MARVLAPMRRTTGSICDCPATAGACASATAFNIARWQFGVLSRGGGAIIGIPFDSASILMIRHLRATPKLEEGVYQRAQLLRLHHVIGVVAAGVLMFVVRRSSGQLCSCNIDTSSDSDDPDSDDDSQNSAVAVTGPAARRTPMVRLRVETAMRRESLCLNPQCGQAQCP